MKLNYRSKTNTYASIISVYLIICIIVLIISIPIFNDMINKHDLEISNNMCGLTAEKLNNSITYVTEAAKGRAEIISCNTITDWNDLSKKLAENMDSSGCDSIGLVDQYYNIYGSGAKYVRDDFSKWGLIMQAKHSDDIMISAPYRQSLSGRMVFTIFAPIYQSGEREGELYMTYYLEEIQNMASSEILEDKMEIFLMNPYSNNYIKCFGGDQTQIGSWNNTKLLYIQIKETTDKTFAQWEEDMRQGKNGQAIYFKKDGVLYTQVFVNIEVMDNWSVVVKIPNDALSRKLRIFHVSVIFLIVFLIIALMGLFFLSTRNANAERRTFEYLSVHDPLTQLANRRAFEHIYEDYLNLMEKTGEKAALIFFDVDYFKQVNDGYGHAMGDRVLIEFAENAVEIFGDSAIVSRFGGDEFIVLCKNYESREIIQEKLMIFKAKLATLDFLKKEGEEPFHIHYSAGLVEINSRDTLDDIEKKADKALYIVKERGRDGFEWYEAGV